jgi:hypothetical protein
VEFDERCLMRRRYAYIEIALYGKPYIAAAKDTWRLFKDRGVDALINDSLVAMSACSLIHRDMLDADWIGSDDMGWFPHRTFVLPLRISLSAVYVLSSPSPLFSHS